ncbi:MAG: hypothetical protein WBD36_09985 [Bacteroidota bacterium]
MSRRAFIVPLIVLSMFLACKEPTEIAGIPDRMEGAAFVVDMFRVAVSYDPKPRVEGTVVFHFEKQYGTVVSMLFAVDSAELAPIPVASSLQPDLQYRWEPLLSVPQHQGQYDSVKVLAALAGMILDPNGSISQRKPFAWKDSVWVFPKVGSFVVDTFRAVLAYEPDPSVKAAIFYHFEEWPASIEYLRIDVQSSEVMTVIDGSHQYPGIQYKWLPSMRVLNPPGPTDSVRVWVNISGKLLAPGVSYLDQERFEWKDSLWILP